MDELSNISIKNNPNRETKVCSDNQEIFDNIKSHLIDSKFQHNCKGNQAISSLAFERIITPFYTRAAAGIDDVIKNGRNFTYAITGMQEENNLKNSLSFAIFK